MQVMLLALMLLSANVVEAKVTVESHKDSSGYVHSTIRDGKNTQRCVTHTDSDKITHTVCDK